MRKMYRMKVREGQVVNDIAVFYVWQTKTKICLSDNFGWLKEGVGSLRTFERAGCKEVNGSGFFYCVPDKR